jgi:beta-lactamase superfamily II metal-dependent hydrolase
MPKLTFFPLGNADSCLIDLANEQKLLFDYANRRNANDSEDLRIDLAAALREDLRKVGRQHFDVVAFTHIDDDHIDGASEFFHLRHAKKYQSDDRIKINELWVPAAVIVEKSCTDEARIIQAEAQYRLREGTGIRVFSRPDRLKEWLKKEDIELKDREDLITDAGKLIPGFTKSIQGVEFFVHSPFAIHLGDGLVDRNENVLVLQATFHCDEQETRLILGADATHNILTDMVNVTRYHENDTRLAWDVFKLPHHCSYLSLSSERGDDMTTPVPEVEWLFEQGASKGVLVSTSKPIPSDDTDTQPPHRQAANYYKECVAAIDGDFIVTMAHPTLASPEPLIITIDSAGATVKKSIVRSSVAITSYRAPRAG